MISNKSKSSAEKMLDKYSQYEVYLLKSGKFALISEVAPPSTMKSDKDRIMYIFMGEPYDGDKNKIFEQTRFVITVPEEKADVAILFTLEDEYKTSVEDFRRYEERYLGKLIDESRKNVIKRYKSNN